MKRYIAIVIMTYQQEVTVDANSPEEAERMMYEKFNPMTAPDCIESKVENMTVNTEYIWSRDVS